MFETSGFLSALFWGALKLLGIVFVIVVPLMVLLEIVQRRRLFDRLIAVVAPVMRFWGFEREAIFPLLAGLSFGVAYGAGVLLQESRENRLSGRQAFLVCTFLGMSHAVFEDTLLFVAVGANGWAVVGVRLLTALVVTFVVAHYVVKVQRA